MDLFGKKADAPDRGESGGPRQPPVILDRIRHQDPAIRALRNAHRRDKTSHAMLFWGPEGVGKMRAAQGWAQMLLCEADASPCGVCASCRRAARFTHPDLLVVMPALKTKPEEGGHKALEAYGADPYHVWKSAQKASIWIERIRELKTESAKARVEKGNRVAIIREADRMTQEAAQAALKLIEEPRPGTYLVLTCRDPQQLLPTIVSHCQRLRFRALPRDFIEAVLRERTALTEAQVRMLAALACGGLGPALARMHEDMPALRDAALRLFETRHTDPAAVTAAVRRLGRTWDLEQAAEAIDLLMMWYEDLMILHYGLPEETITNADRLEQLRAAAQATTVDEIKRRVGILEELQAAARQHVNLVLATETALLRLSWLVPQRGNPWGATG